MDLLSQQLTQQNLAVGAASQLDSQEMGEVAASWEAKRGSITGVLSMPLSPGNTGSWVRGSAPLYPENRGIMGGSLQLISVYK